MLKYLLIISILSVSNIYASFTTATKNIYYGKELTRLNTKEISSIKNNISCENIDFSQIQKEKYIALHYIKKNSIICKKDIKKIEENKVVYKFGNFLEVEEYGKVITETNKYIKIKKPNGKIKKLYKDGNK